jgi:N-acetylmuramic acid 6-phosphate etherase
VTEALNPRSAAIDRVATLAVLTLMNDEDATVPDVVRSALPAIAAAVDGIVERLRSGGRLVYAGAGTSGRLAMLDAVECVPTFGTPPEMVQALVAGGARALTTSIEGAEDDEAAGRTDVARLELGEYDALVGVAASGSTPYVRGALGEARNRGALTVAIACNTPAPILDLAEHAIALPTGPEVIAGSTRLKAGTAQKLVLNMISTATMVRLGRVYGNWMVDVSVTNAKLRRRAVRIVRELLDVDQPRAERLLRDAGNEVKTAVLMGLTGRDAEAARSALAASGGVLRTAIERAERAVPDPDRHLRGGSVDRSRRRDGEEE